MACEPITLLCNTNKLKTEAGCVQLLSSTPFTENFGSTTGKLCFHGTYDIRVAISYHYSCKIDSQTFSIISVFTKRERKCWKTWAVWKFDQLRTIPSYKFLDTAGQMDIQWFTLNNDNNDKIKSFTLKYFGTLHLLSKYLQIHSTCTSLVIGQMKGVFDRTSHYCAQIHWVSQKDP